MSKKNALQMRMARLWFGLGKRADFYADLHAFLDAGKAPGQIIEEMLSIASKRRSLKNMALILRDVLHSLKSGKTSLGDALSHWIPPVEATMLVSGERSGQLLAASKELAWNVGEQARIINAALTKIIPLVVLIIAAIGLSVFVTLLVAPQAEKMVRPEIMTKLMIAPGYIWMGKFIQGWGWLLGLAALSAIAGAWYSLSRWRGASRNRFAFMPPWSIYAWTQTSFFLSSLSSMLRSGMTLRDALREIQRHATPWQRWHLRRMLIGLERGLPEVKAMDTGMFPVYVSDRLQMYASLPSFVEVMARLARDSIRRYEEVLTRLAGYISIAVLLFLATFILLTFGSLGEIALAVEESARAARQSAGF